MLLQEVDSCSILLGGEVGVKMNLSVKQKIKFTIVNVSVYSKLKVLKISPAHKEALKVWFSFSEWWFGYMGRHSVDKGLWQGCRIIQGKISCSVFCICASILPKRALIVAFWSQSALKGEEDPQVSKENQPGKKRKNSKKNQSRKRSNAPPEKEVGNWE